MGAEGGDAERNAPRAVYPTSLVDMLQQGWVGGGGGGGRRGGGEGGGGGGGGEGGGGREEGREEDLDLGRVESEQRLVDTLAASVLDIA